MGPQRRRRDVRVGFWVVVCLLLLRLAVGAVAAQPRAALQPTQPSYTVHRSEQDSGVAQLEIDFLDTYETETVLLFFLPADIQIAAATPDDAEMVLNIVDQSEDAAAWQAYQARVGAAPTLDYVIELSAPLNGSYVDPVRLAVTLDVASPSADDPIEYVLIDREPVAGEALPGLTRIGPPGMEEIRRAAAQPEATVTPESPAGLEGFPVSDLATFVTLRLSPPAAESSRVELFVTLDRRQYAESVLLFLFFPPDQFVLESELERLEEAQRVAWGERISMEKGLAQPLGGVFRVPADVSSVTISLQVGSSFASDVDNVLSVVVATDPPLTPPALPAVSEPLPVPGSAALLSQAAANAGTATVQAAPTATTEATLAPTTAATEADAAGAADATATARAVERQQQEDRGGEGLIDRLRRALGDNTGLVILLLFLILVFIVVLVAIIMRMLRTPPAPTPPAPAEGRPTARLGPSLTPSGGGAEIKIQKMPFTIGRATDNDLVIDERFAQATTVSRHHAVIRRQNGEVVIVDRNSQNGIRVNGRPTAKNLLQDGWHVTIGGVEFVFHGGTPGNQQQGGLSS